MSSVTVYAVEHGDYSDRATEVLFVTRELADAYITARVDAAMAYDKASGWREERSEYLYRWNVVEYQLWSDLPVVPKAFDRYDDLPWGDSSSGVAAEYAATRSAQDETPLDVERWLEAVSDSLAAATEGTDWAEAPEPSDEPGSPYVRRLTNELLSRLHLDVERLMRTMRYHPDLRGKEGEYADGWDAATRTLLDLLAATPSAQDETPLSEPLDPIDHLVAIQNHLNDLRSDGPFIDGLTAEGPWWTAPDSELVRLYEAIIAASDKLDARLATPSASR